MKKLYLFTLLALFSSAIMFGQTVTWSAAADGLWSDPNNWDTGVVPVEGDEVRLGIPNVCTVDADAAFGRLRLGRDGDAEMIIKTGVTLATAAATDWHSLGENSKGTLTVEADAMLDLENKHNYIGQNGGDAEIHLWGTIKNKASLRLAEKGGISNVTIYPGGSLITRYISGVDRWGAGAHMDIRGGEFRCTQIEGEVATFIEMGYIIAYGGGGKIIYEELDGNTIVTSEEDLTAPIIESSAPMNAETGVPGEVPIVINFSKWMANASVEAALTVSPAIGNQTLTWSQNTLTISGDAMTPLTAYTVTIGTGATDVNGIAVASELSFTFTTIDPDAPPVVVTTSPADGATDINEGSPIVINFSKAMDSTSVADAITVVPALENPINSIDESGKSFSITHDNAPWNQVYTVTVAAGAKASADATALEADLTFSYTVRGMPTTTTVWNPAQDGSSDGLWMTAANWTTGVVPDDPSYNYKVVLNVPGAGSVHLTDSVNVNSIRLGEKAAGDTLFIHENGYLKTNGEWNGFGIEDTSVVIIDAGGTLDLSSHAWIAYHDKAYSEIDVFGTMFIKGSTGLNWADDGGVGVLTIHEGGVLNMRSLNDFAESGKNTASIHDGSVIDVNGGEWTINRHDGQKAVAKQYIEAGRITAFGGDGFVRVVEDSIISATDTTLLTTITSTMERNTDATLSALTSDVGGTFTPAFDPAVTTYDLVVPMFSFWATISGEVNDKYASVSEAVFVDLSTSSGQAVITVTAEDGSTQDYTVNITVSEVSVEDNISEMTENAYYIPSQDVVRVENAATVEMIRVFDVTGKLRINTKVSSSDTFDVDASALTQGLYIIQLKSSDNNRHSFKFIK